MTTSGSYKDRPPEVLRRACSVTTGALATISGGSIATSGSGATAVSVNRGGVVHIQDAIVAADRRRLVGLAVHSAGSEIDALNVTISTSGGHDAVTGDNAYGAYNGAYGTYLTGGLLKLTDLSISTSSDKMVGVLTTDGGVTTIADTVPGHSITTEGNSAYAVVSEGAGKTTLSGATITTTGDGSGGLGVNGAGSRIDATHVTISTTGGFDFLHRPARLWRLQWPVWLFHVGRRPEPHQLFGQHPWLWDGRRLYGDGRGHDDHRRDDEIHRRIGGGRFHDQRRIDRDQRGDGHDDRRGFLRGRGGRGRSHDQFFRK